MPDPNTEHGLRVQLATALRERDTALAQETYWHNRATEARDEAEKLRTALQDIVTLCMDVPATEGWRAKVGDKARKALYGEPGWKQT